MPCIVIKVLVIQSNYNRRYKLAAPMPRVSPCFPAHIWNICKYKVIGFSNTFSGPSHSPCTNLLQEFAPLTAIMRLSSIVGIFCGSLGFAAADNFIINHNDGRYQACFIDGHEWWFCSKYYEGDWSAQTSRVQIGCGYQYQISEGVVTMTSDNGCGFKSHCSLAWDDDTGKMGCNLKLDHANC
ncbi:uncharacterized protein BDR25DRAFT_396133 [Lindgomyces ingoldianus]|uniref:Uncharacterized protein n=1 Tax=Lindgomyces ingoldianus TaxID=673940 RepID=A0ACB6QER7_9PLEO|nr:uncharacterized protein BDR25DRAFT_396133 [Lindgomyces ingoldianus]KAF2465392.1 hypothetical protein BDR25DRAFT_396133 [Lindgomyces ingoldianus]